jgi:hypothetical protein
MSFANENLYYGGLEYICEKKVHVIMYLKNVNIFKSDWYDI